MRHLHRLSGLFLLNDAYGEHIEAAPGGGFVRNHSRKTMLDDGRLAIVIIEWAVVTRHIAPCVFDI